MEKISLEQQMKAVGMALRDARRELVRTNDSEISQELAEQIRGLEAARESLRSLSVVVKFFSDLG